MSQAIAGVILRVIITCNSIGDGTDYDAGYGTRYGTGSDTDQGMGYVARYGTGYGTGNDPDYAKVMVHVID